MPNNITNDAEQRTLFGDRVRVHFDGDTYNPKLDFTRLERQRERIGYVLTRSPRQQWYTLDEIRDYCWLFWSVKYSEASISARLRDFRKPKFGGHTVERRRSSKHDGLHEYRLILREGAAA